MVFVEWKTDNTIALNILALYIFLIIHFSSRSLPLSWSSPHNPSPISPPFIVWVSGIPWVSLLTLALQGSGRLGVSSPSEAKQGSLLEEHTPYVGNNFWDNPLYSCSEPTWSPSCTSATYEQGGLGIACVCTLVGGSVFESPKGAG